MSAKATQGRSDEAVRQEAVAWLAKLRSGPDAAEEAAFEEWYAADYPQHARIYDAVLDNWDKMGIAAQTPIARKQARLFGRPNRRSRRIVLAAAAAVLALIAGAESYRLGLIGAPSPPVEIASRVGEIHAMTLPDGSRVTLDTSSAIRASYSSSERRVTLLKGRARFDVAHDPARPFMVQAGAGLVIAHGTLFDVAIRKGALTVSLLRGAVEVRTIAGKAGAPGRMLKPGERLSIEADDQPAMLSPVTPDEMRWPTGMRSFDNEPLDRVVAEINRYSSSQIILADPASLGARYTGTLSTKDPVGVAHMIAASYDLALSQDGRGNIVLGSHTGAQK